VSVLLSDIKFRAAAVTPEDDAATEIGGTIDLSKKFDFTDFSGPAQVVSDGAYDTATVTVTYRDAGGEIQSVGIVLDGETVVTDPAEITSILKAVKSATCAGNVALESQTAALTGTLDGLGAAADEVVLPYFAAGVAPGMVFRATGGAGGGEIAEVIDYDDYTRVATLSRNVAATFDGTTTFRISRGVFFDTAPDEIMYVVRTGYDTQSNAPGGLEIDFYEKGYFKHTDASGSGLTLTSCVVALGDAPAGRVATALDAAVNGSGSNGAGNNRRVAPVTSVTGFSESDKVVPGGSLAPGDTVGVWMKLIDDPATGRALRETWTPVLQAVTA